MNSFETDLKRAFYSWHFLAGLVVECIILLYSGSSSELFQMSVPVLPSLPYSVAWLDEYQSGFLKSYLPRCGQNAYIWGKFLSCGISGGALLAIACFLCPQTAEGQPMQIDIFLIFLSGMFWAVTAAVLAAAANSRYVAYGGSFVIFYMLIILCERYFKSLYCLYPVEWYERKHIWVFGGTGIILMLTGLISIMGIFYYSILRGCMARA